MQISVPNKLVLVDKKWGPTLRLHLPKVADVGDYSVVPHAVDTSIVMRNLGLDVPSPIYYRYGWPTHHPAPFAHQKITSAFLTMNRRAFCLSEMGTSKTLSAYWAADFLMREKIIRRALVVAPLSTLEAVHAQTIFSNFVGPYQRSFAVLHGSRDTRIKLAKGRYDFYIVNFDGLATVAKTLLARGDIDLVLIDEIAILRNAGTQRWKLTKQFIQPHQWVWGLTGAPTPNEPTDAYAQVKLIKPESLGPHLQSAQQFKFATMEQVSAFRWIPRPTAMQTVAKVMQPAIRFTRDECLDLPPLVTTTHDVELTAEQRRTYKDLAKLYATQINGAQITAINEGVKMMRLVQCVSGVLYDRDGEHQVVDCAPRLQVVKELIEQSDAKVLIFVPFKGNLTLLQKEIGKLCSVHCVSGDTPTGERKAVFKAFQTTPDPHCLIMHPACTSHGLDLTAASTIIWWAPINSNDVFEQANARPNRSGQVHKMALRLLSGSAVEKAMYKRLVERQKMQGLLLDILKDGVN